MRNIVSPRAGVTARVRPVNISLGLHPTSEEELLSFPELRNYESSNSSRKTASEFIDECVLPRPAYLGCECQVFLPTDTAAS